MTFFNEIPSKRRNGQVASLKDAFQEMLQQTNLSTKFKEASLLATWQQMMGETIAEKTLRLFIKEKVLYAELSSAPLKAELTMAKTHIITQLNAQAGEKLIETVIFI